MELNKLQTPIEELHLEECPKEVQDQFWDFFSNIPYIQNLVSSTRKRACDMRKERL